MVAHAAGGLYEPAAVVRDGPGRAADWRSARRPGWHDAATMRRLLAILALALSLSACRFLNLGEGADAQPATPPASPSTSAPAAASGGPASGSDMPSPSIEIPPPIR